MNTDQVDDITRTASKNNSNRNAIPQLYVPKVDKKTGEPIPEWKQKLLLTKMTKKFVELESNNDHLSTGMDLPDWKKEVLAKKEQRLMASEDPLYIRKRKIRAIEEECNSMQTPPWKEELLRKKIDQIHEEIKQIERETTTNDEGTYELFNAKAFRDEAH